MCHTRSRHGGHRHSRRGRFWRRPIVDQLIGLGHDVVLLQTDRDRTEAGQRLPYQWDAGFPAIDVLMF